QPRRTFGARRDIYPLPLPDSAGAALVPMVAPQHVPVYVAAMGPANLRLTGAVADGWLGNAFIPEVADVFLGPLREGAERAGRSLADLSLVAPVAVEFTDDATAPHGVMPTGTRSPSGRWAPDPATSTT
ncbi:LLM class flavin-dependent oxidoreductase, partial [Mycobacterium celatum]|uniref:LLM class flavin-dependent oxidoreductase n=1 Tax=Mycobacterium celatum TaxID=28045 RepID=UPI000ABC8E1E